MESDSLINIEVVPVTKSNWTLFEKLFGERGASGNCWCMYYRLSKADFHAGQSDDGNKNAMKDLIWNSKPAGLLGLLEGEPIAWCAFAPRQDFIKIERSRVHKRIDNEEVWSIPCFFITRKYRNSGVTFLLLKGAIEYAKKQGIKIIEAYPAIPTKKKIPDSFAWFGFYKTFERAGFEIVDKTSQNRPMVRCYL